MIVRVLTTQFISELHKHKYTEIKGNSHMELKLGINTGFAINRFQTPEQWGSFVGELGVHSVQLTASVLNPFWDRDYLESLIYRIEEASKRYDFTIDSIFTDAYTRVNHLTHPDEDGQKMWYNWFCRLLEIGARLGAKAGGSHFGILTVESCNDPSERERLTECGVKNWQRLTKVAEDLGMEYMFFEPMSIPREFANTVGQTRELLDRVNADCGVPMRVCLDIGHAPHPDERDCYPWIRQLGNVSPIIHLQQTELNRSNHWSFTKANNEKGYITAEKVLQCLDESGCKKTDLVLELSHREHWDTDHLVFSDHKESVDYWRQYVQD